MTPRVTRACPACGYDLRGIEGAVCPECGIDVADGERQARAARRILHAMLLSPLLQGFAILVLVPWTNTQRAFLCYALVALVFGVPAAAAAYGYRQAKMHGVTLRPPRFNAICGALFGVAMVLFWVFVLPAITRVP